MRMLIVLLLSLAGVTLQQEAPASITGLIVAWPAAATANEALTNYLISRYAQGNDPDRLVAR